MMILKKKTIIIITLVLLIVAAGYISTRYASTDDVNTPNDNTILTDENVDNTDLTSVNTQVAAGYFIDEKIGRENQRTIDKQTLTDIINNDKTSKEAKADAEKKLLNLVNYSEKEMIIEALIKSKGFEDALVFLSDGSANVTIKAKTINSDQVSQVKNIVCRESNFPASSIMVQNRE